MIRSTEIRSARLVEALELFRRRGYRVRRADSSALSPGDVRATSPERIEWRALDEIPARLELQEAPCPR